MGIDSSVFNQGKNDGNADVSDGENYLHWTQSERIGNMEDEFVQKFTH